MENNFLNIFSLAYNLTNAITQALLLRFYQHLAPYNRVRIVGSLSVILVLCFITTGAFITSTYIVYLNTQCWFNGSVPVNAFFYYLFCSVCFVTLRNVCFTFSLCSSTGHVCDVALLDGSLSNTM